MSMRDKVRRSIIHHKELVIKEHTKEEEDTEDIEDGDKDVDEDR